MGAVLDTKNKVKDKANAVKENIKDMPTQTAYAVYSAKEKAKSSVSDFKRGMVQEQQSRQTGRLEKQEPVSYTHLDVYKRQALSLSLVRFTILISWAISGSVSFQLPRSDFGSKITACPPKRCV